MNRYQAMVRLFNEKYGLPVDRCLMTETDGRSERYLREIGDLLVRLSVGALDEAKLGQHRGDHRVWNAHLLLEEVGELFIAMADRDEVETADGIGDTIYVAIGIAVRYNIPIKEVFEEIHRSNMTKKPSPDGRLRDKTGSYSPPDIQGAISHGRSIREH